ncbi:hypothetical protein [Raineya sp.]|jgi:hypothetical protein
MKLLKIFVFWVLPLIFGYTLYLAKASFTDFHTGYNSDPSYVYLINATNLAYGKNPQHVDHPGTTLQYLGVVVIRTLYWIDGEKSTLAEDVLTYPEKYLHTFANVIIVLNVLASFVIGWIAYHYTQKLWIGIYLQLTPFLFLHIAAFNIPRVAAESLLWIHSTIIALYCILFYTQKERFLDTTKQIWGFSLAIISGIVTKITLAPLGLLPFFFLKKKNDKMYYVLVCIVLFAILAMPALFSHEYFYFWVRGLLIRSGYYNSGEANFLNFNMFKENIRDLFSTQGSYFIIAFLSSFIVFLAWIQKKSEIDESIRKKLLLCLLAFVCINIIYLIFIGKHYQYRYALPLLSFGYCFLVIFYMFLSRIFKWYWLVMPSVITSIYIISHQKQLFQEELVNTKNEVIKRKQIQENALNEKNAIILYYYPCSSPKYALGFGLGYSGAMKVNYRNILKKIYPDYLEFNIWNNWCYSWGEPISIDEIISKNKRILMVGGAITTSPLEIRKNDTEILSLPIRLVMENGSGEFIYEILHQK